MENDYMEAMLMRFEDLIAEMGCGDGRINPLHAWPDSHVERLLTLVGLEFSRRLMDDEDVASSVTKRRRKSKPKQKHCVCG